ncbi:hypothetical protein DSOL_4084 [Desulfosporosinus metallidurans]|uniref:Uncharacterized protein n=2 Tax=Desulfosporosinus metallidurans TaxID=1888891 RepID=A0A1Q8QM85_9FIRM|nr:hypothetical protein DSOL_4084 [Desulfosporosinus metallidurans]
MYHKGQLERLSSIISAESDHPDEEQPFAPLASTEELAEREMTLEILLSVLIVYAFK